MDLRNNILNASRDTGLNEKLIAAVIHKESEGRCFVSRYEKGFERDYLKGKSKLQLGGHIPTTITWDTEFKDRATSFGPMQVLGQKAREMGFSEESLLTLCLPENNIPLGARILKGYLDESPNLEYVLRRRWNGGGNPSYGKDVIKIMESGTADYLLIK